MPENTRSGRTVLHKLPSQGQAGKNPAVSARWAQVGTPTHYCTASVGLLRPDLQLNPLIGQCLEQLGTDGGWFAT